MGEAISTKGEVISLKSEAISDDIYSLPGPQGSHRLVLCSSSILMGTVCKQK